MAKSKLTTKVYSSIADSELKATWVFLQHETKAFPQMYYEWVAPWWRQNQKGRTLHVVVVYNERDEPVGLAPFCIRREFGIKVLSSIPIHFGDFFTILTLDVKSLNIIIQYIKECKNWKAVHLFNCFDNSITFNQLMNARFKSKLTVRIIEPTFEGIEFDDYLKELSKNTRSQFKKKLRRLEKTSQVEVLAIKNWDGYKKFFPETKRLYNLRWKEDKRPLLSDQYYLMRNQSLKPLFEKGCATLFIIKCNEKVIAFRLGFIYKRTFYDWKTAHDPNYDYYSPGFLSIGLIIERLIEQRLNSFNFMTGNYRYKRSWNNRLEKNYNYELLFANNSVGKIFVAYRLKLRDKIKDLAIKLKLK